MTDTALVFSVEDLVERLDKLAAAQDTEDGSVTLDAATFVMAASAAAHLAGHVAEVDLTPWTYGGLPAMPRLGYGPGVSFTAPGAAVVDRKGNVKRPARPITARLSGPTAGILTTADPAELHAHGLHLIDAAATLAAIKAAHDPQEPPTQEELPT